MRCGEEKKVPTETDSPVHRLEREMQNDHKDATEY